MRYILFVLLLTGGLLSFNSYALDYILPPVTIGTISHDATIDSNGYFNTTWYGVPYICFDCIFNDDGKTASGTWYRNDGTYDVPFPDKKPTTSSDKPESGSFGDSGSDDSTPAGGGSGSPDGTDSGTGMTGGSTDGSASGTSSGSSTPSPVQPEKPYPADVGASQLLDSYNSCAIQVQNLPSDISDEVFNSVAANCNVILERLSSVLLPGEINPLSIDNSEFLTKNTSGSVFSCHKTTDDERQRMIDKGYYPSSVPDAIGFYVSGFPERDSHHLNINYVKGDSDNVYCDSVYQNYMRSLNKVSSGSGEFHPGVSLLPEGPFSVEISNNSNNNPLYIAFSGFPEDNSPFNFPGATLRMGRKPGKYEGETPFEMMGHELDELKAFHYDSNNGDSKILSELEGIHSDANKNHEETMKALDTSGVSLDGVKDGLSSDINKLINDTKNELNDSYNDALAELKGVFGDIDSYVPDIKLSFDLPTQFTAGIMGRCVPLVFDFNISLVGFQPYHFHAEGVQACQLYDAYIRSIVEYMLYFMTALACRRIFTRAAEFMTSQP